MKPWLLFLVLLASFITGCWDNQPNTSTNHPTPATDGDTDNSVIGDDDQLDTPSTPDGDIEEQEEQPPVGQ